MILHRDEIIKLLLSEGREKEDLFERSAAVKRATVGNVTYMRGLIEYSNVCRKNCFYCGIRCSNDSVSRYTLTDTEVLDAARFAYENKFGSVEILGESQLR